MDEDSKKLIEIFVTIVFSGAISYFLVFISETNRIENNAIWFVASFIVMFATILMIHFIFGFNIDTDKIILSRIVFVVFIVLTIFSITRFLYCCESIGDIDTINISIIYDSFNAILFTFGMAAFTLLLNGFIDTKRKNTIVFSSIVLFVLIGVFFVIREPLINGVIS